MIARDKVGHRGAGLLAVWLTAVWGAALTEPPALGDERVSPAVRREFERIFGDRTRRLGPDGEPEARGELAKEIFLEARARSDDPKFVAYALDRVIELASPSAEHQRLVYAALQTQKRSRLKGPEPTLRQMMSVANQAVRSMDVGERSHWLRTVWLRDAMDLASLYCREGAYGKARSVLEEVKRVAQELHIGLPTDVTENIEGFGLLSRLTVGSPGRAAAGPRDHLYLAVLAVVRDADLRGAAGHLRRAGGPDTLQLAEALEAEAAGTEPVGAQARVASAVASLGLPSLVEQQLRHHLERISPGPLGRIVEQTFFGIPFQGTRRIVFIVDFSGSMSDRLYYAKEELKRAVGSLTSDQSFQVIFFDTEAVEMPGTGVFPATDENKARARGFIDGMGAGGGTDPSHALRRAFALGADTVYLLTDGEFQPVIVSLVDGLNAGRKVRVNAICFFSRSGENVLRRIAERNSGTYKFVGD